ncbi:MAG: hypothetical protein RhofKO_40540 [Rhodothermales bacterium]
MADSNVEPLGLFTQSIVALPAALIAMLYITLIGYRFLPNRGLSSERVVSDLEDYFFDIKVQSGGQLVGKTVDEAGLRALEEAFLVHIRHRDSLVQATPDTILSANDTLTFRGAPAAFDYLLSREGLERPVDALPEIESSTLSLFEAVVSASSSIVGKTLREAEFREQYDGVVLAIHRAGESIPGSLGRTPIRAGDLLLIEANNGYDKRWNQRRDEFYLVASRQPNGETGKVHKAPVALCILVGVVSSAALDIISIVIAAFVGALAMIITGCLRSTDARHSIDMQVVIVIAAALGLGRAVELSGLAALGAEGLTQIALFSGPLGALVVVYLGTVILSEIVTNNAAAALMIGVGLSTAQQLNVSSTAFGIAVAIGASSSFLTPIGYQTNLMVMGPGGYRFSDYFSVGIGVTLIFGLGVLSMIAFIYL